MTSFDAYELVAQEFIVFLLSPPPDQSAFSVKGRRRRTSFYRERSFSATFLAARIAATASILRDNFLDAVAHGDEAKDWSAVAEVAMRHADFVTARQAAKVAKGDSAAH